MKVILLQNVQKVGKKYEIKDISDGHALNLLIPKGLAITATPANVKRFEEQKKKAEEENAIQEELLVKTIESLQGKKITIEAKANESGHLFAGIHTEQIAQVLEKDLRIAIDSQYIALDEPIKKVGEHSVPVHVGDTKATLTVEVIAQ